MAVQGTMVTTWLIHLGVASPIIFCHLGANSWHKYECPDWAYMAQGWGGAGSGLMDGSTLHPLSLARQSTSLPPSALLLPLLAGLCSIPGLVQLPEPTQHLMRRRRHALQ